ncbi:MAG: hypothetical protein V2J12_10480 [Gammaproteobacteria bacterium]|jgi:hypothetical protein|nr:hypothetical protein [Gammaproteobacteria bacterium]
MTKQGKYNLLGIFLLPLAVVVAAAIASLNGVWNAYAATYGFLFGINLAVMLIFGLLSGLLLLWSGGDRSRWLAVMPTLLTAGFGAVWYLFRAVFPAEVAAGAEYIGALQYLPIVGLGAFIVVLLLRVTGIVKRTA